jgi:hypothetical protein
MAIDKAPSFISRSGYAPDDDPLIVAELDCLALCGSPCCPWGPCGGGCPCTKICRHLLNTGTHHDKADDPWHRDTGAV